MDSVKLRAAAEAAQKKALDVKARIAAADAETMTDDEAKALETEFSDAVAEVERTKKNLESRIAQEKILAEALPAPEPVEKRHPDARGSMRVELTYRPDAHGDQPTFFRDLWRGQSDSGAIERLYRNNKEFAGQVEKRAGLNQTATTAGEFIYPVWLDAYAAKLRAGRAIMDALAPQAWLPTNSINLPAITTGASAAVQTDGGSVSNTDWVTATITAQAQSIAGRTVASRQLVDLGSPGLDQAIFSDLLSALNQQKDIAVINGAVTNAKGLLNVTGINNPTYVDATPTLAEFYPALFQGKSQIEKNAFDSPHFIALHTSVWNSFLGDLDSSSRPLALAMDAAAFNASAQFEYAAQGLVGNLGGLPVIADANIPATLGGGTETAAIIVNRRGFDVWESEPYFQVADQTSITTLQLQFVMWSYYAVMSRQPKMLAKVTGTGMIPRANF